MDTFNDLQKSDRGEDRLKHDFLINLLDQLFGKDQHSKVIRIDSSIETDERHRDIKNCWKMIQQYYRVNNSVKYTKKLVRQTLMHIVHYLNDKYDFKRPIKFEFHRYDYRKRGIEKKFTDFWTDVALV